MSGLAESQPMLSLMTDMLPTLLYKWVGQLRGYRGNVVLNTKEEQPLLQQFELAISTL